MNPNLKMTWCQSWSAPESLIINNCWTIWVNQFICHKSTGKYEMNQISFLWVLMIQKQIKRYDQSMAWTTPKLVEIHFYEGINCDNIVWSFVVNLLYFTWHQWCNLAPISDTHGSVLTTKIHIKIAKLKTKSAAATLHHFSLPRLTTITPSGIVPMQAL